MDVGAQLLQALLMGDAEALFLIDDHQTEPLEIHRFGEQRMGADDQIDLALGQTRAGGAGFLFGHEAREAAHLQRETGEAFGKALVVLARQKRGGRHHRHLHACHGGDETGAQSHLGLAEADIAADQTVHRLAAGQILQHVADGGFLILGLVPGEAVDEGAKLAGSLTSAGAVRRARRAAVFSNSWAISRMRSLSLARRFCHASPPRRSSATPSFSAPKRDKTSRFSTGM
jgi:hypothetical protein